MRESVIVARFEGCVAEIGGGHAEGQQDFFANVVFPSFTGDGGNDLAGGDVHEIVVSVVTAEAGGGLHEAKAIDDVFAREGGVRPEEEIAFAESHAAAMGEEIADGHFVGRSEEHTSELQSRQYL